MGLRKKTAARFLLLLILVVSAIFGGFRLGNSKNTSTRVVDVSSVSVKNISLIDEDFILNAPMDATNLNSQQPTIKIMPLCVPGGSVHDGIVEQKANNEPRFVGLIGYVSIMNSNMTGLTRISLDVPSYGSVEQSVQQTPGVTPLRLTFDIVNREEVLTYELRLYRKNAQDLILKGNVSTDCTKFKLSIVTGISQMVRI